MSGQSLKNFQQKKTQPRPSITWLLPFIFTLALLLSFLINDWLAKLKYYALAPEFFSLSHFSTLSISLLSLLGMSFDLIFICKSILSFGKFILRHYGIIFTFPDKPSPYCPCNPPSCFLRISLALTSIVYCNLYTYVLPATGYLPSPYLTP